MMPGPRSVRRRGASGSVLGRSKLLRWLTRSVLLVSCLAWPAQALDVHYLVALRTDVRGRNAVPGIDLGTGVTADLELDPRAEVTLGGDLDTFFLQYAPTLIWREPQAGGQFLPLNRGRLAYTHRWGRASLLLSEDGAYGTADITALRLDPSQPLSVGEVQTVGAVPYVRSATLLSLETRPTDRFTFGLSGGYSLSGSPERVDVMPLQYGPTGSARARASIGQTDGLTTGATVMAAHFVTGAEQFVAQLTETWDRQLSRTLVLNLGVGPALTREVVVDPLLGIPGTYTELLPVGTASLSWRDTLAGHPLRLDSSVRLGPFSDRFTGSVYERLEARVQGEWRPARDWLAMAATGGAIGVPISSRDLVTGQFPPSVQAGDRLIFGEANLTWTVNTWLLLQASARVLWTDQPRLGIPGLVQAVGTVSVTVHEQDSLAW